jgi:hypothetical protein
MDGFSVWQGTLQMATTVHAHYVSVYELFTSYDCTNNMWLGHYAASWKVAGLIPNYVSGFFI